MALAVTRERTRMSEFVESELNKSVVHRFDELVRDGDPADLDALCTPDMVNHALAQTRPSGLAGTREFLYECQEDPPRAAWKRGITHRAERLVAEGDLVAQFAVVTATWPGGCFRGVETASGPYETDAAFIYRFVDGRIAERWAVRDDLGMMLQLRALR
jgi:ketosteroid isomerase-like protein